MARLGVGGRSYGEWLSKASGIATDEVKSESGCRTGLVLVLLLSVDCSGSDYSQ